MARRGRKRFIASWGQDVTYLSLHPCPPPFPPRSKGSKVEGVILPTSASCSGRGDPVSLVKFCSDVSEDKSSNMHQLVVQEQGNMFSAAFQPAAWHSVCFSLQARFPANIFFKGLGHEMEFKYFDKNGYYVVLIGTSTLSFNI